MTLFKSGLAQIVLLVITVILFGCASPYQKKVDAINNGEVSQYELALIASNRNADSNIRILAIKKITDEAVLLKIALDDYAGGYNYLARPAAIQRITDQNLLVQVLFESKDAEVRKLAMDKLKDKTVLCKHVSAGKMIEINTPFPYSMMRSKATCEIVDVSRESGTAILKCPEINVSSGSDCHAPYPGAPLICSHTDPDRPLNMTVGCFDIPR
jgi:hypothetical protein